MKEFNRDYYKKLKCKYPERVPVYIEYSDIDVTKKKFLVPEEMTISYLVYYLRKMFKCNPTEGYVFFFNNEIVAQSVTIAQIEHGDFIRVVIKKENIFGSL